MTKEQEAIEKCKEIIQQNKEIVKQARLSKDTNAIELTANCNKESIAIETVLNMLKEKDEEIEKYKKLLADNLAKGLNDSIKAKSKAENDLYDFAEGIQEDLDRKDKIINIMAERINWLCKTNGILLDKEHGEHFDKEAIKQYFERKATNDG